VLRHFASITLDGAVLPALRHLWLDRCQAIQVAGSAALPSLRYLNIWGSGLGEDVVALPEAVLQRAPRLAKLSYVHYTHPVPASKVQALAHWNSAQGLTSLKLTDSGLDSLPPGPYLSSLQELSLSDCGLVNVPPSLAAATQLRTLDLRGNTSLRISSADVNSVLRPLQQLTRLCLPSMYSDEQCLSDADREQLFALLPQLQPLDGCVEIL